MSRYLQIRIIYAVLICLLCFGIGFTASSLSSSKQEFLPSANGIIREGGYPFINPLISCNLHEDIPEDSFEELHSAVSQAIQELIHQGKATRIGFYFRDVNYGNWTGINEDEKFAPASLNKVPLMLAYLHDARQNSSLLEQRYTVTKVEESTKSEYFAPSVSLQLNGSATGQELLEAMIKRSDNTAAAILISNVATSSLLDVYSIANVPPVEDPAADHMSSKEFMTFLRILYNASYLGRANSQRAFELLATTEFTAGLVAGVPKKTTVAHKFGERTTLTADGKIKNRQLHDCGIVYLPGQPYGICIMTEGYDFEALSTAIAKISNITYTHVANGLLNR